jgi:hypothetical protein
MSKKINLFGHLQIHQEKFQKIIEIYGMDPYLQEKL